MKKNIRNVVLTFGLITVVAVGTAQFNMKQEAAADPLSKIYEVEMEKAEEDLREVLADRLTLQRNEVENIQALEKVRLLEEVEIEKAVEAAAISTAKDASARQAAIEAAAEADARRQAAAVAAQKADQEKANELAAQQAAEAKAAEIAAQQAADLAAAAQRDARRSRAS